MTVDGALRLIELVGIVLAVVAFGAAPVSRGRLERFAASQRLAVTATNGHQVIDYLTTTRRWRTAGFLGGYLVSQATQPYRLGEISTGTEWIIVFVGWFLGFFVAEVRVARLEHGRLRSASLVRRQPGRYVRPFAWALMPATAVVAVVTGAATAVAGKLGWADPDWTWAAVWLAASIAVAAIVRAVQHAVLGRPQPLAAPDVIEADDAIRARSLQVLCASGAALVLLMVLNQIGSIHPVGVRESIVLSVRIEGAVVVAILGWLVARSAWPRSATGGRADTPVIGTA